MALESFPQVRAQLEGRAVQLVRGEQESEAEFDERLATALMALFRDTQNRVVFEALHRLSEASVRRWVAHLALRMNSPREVCELVQDTYVNVYRYSSRFRSEHRSSFRVWVRTIAANIIKRSLTSARLCSLHALPEGLQEPRDSSAGPSALVMQNEETRDLFVTWQLFLLQYLRAFEQLSARDRRALELVEAEGKTYAEAGAILEVGSSNMKMIMFRARRRLFAHLHRSLVCADAQAA